MHTVFGARKAAAQGQASRAGAIDIHAHFFPEGYIQALAEEGGPPGIRFDLSTPGAPALVLGNNRVSLDVTYWDLDKRLERMNAQGVTVHALSLTVPMVHWAPPERGARLARIVNDAMVEAHTAFPDRFVGCAALPIQDPALAVKELDRLAGSRAIRGVYLPTNTGHGELSDPALFPIYERCEAHNLPVLLHPVGVIGADRLRAFYLSNLLGNPFDTAVAAAYLVFGGVLDRFPRLTIVLPHAGGALPYLVGRLQHGQGVRPEAKNVAQRPFTEYVRRFYYDTITHSAELLRFLVGLVGVDRVMLGSDYCFDMGYERPREIVTELGLPPEDRDKIFYANAARLFGL
jgi:aminocarboxymuconate-semialdehyde decarboxylase